MMHLHLLDRLSLRCWSTGQWMKCKLLVIVLIAVATHSQPPPPPPPAQFAAGVLLVTQESLDHAPEKYPEILQLVQNATANVSSQPLPFRDSGSLTSCGDMANATAPEVQWMAYLNETVKTMSVIQNSVQATILADGIKLQTQVQTNFSAPVWAAACAGGLIIKNPENYPQILNAIQEGTKDVAQNVKSQLHDASQTSGCQSHYWWSGSQATVTVRYINGSLRISDNPAVPHTSYIAEADISVSISVPLATQAEATIGTFGCLTKDKESGTAVASGVITLSVVPNCLVCPLNGLAPVNVVYNTSAVLGNFTHNVCCSFGAGDQLLSAAQSLIAGEAQQLLLQYLESQSDTDKLLSCGCEVVCPNTTDTTRGNLSGSFTSTLTTMIHVSDNPGGIPALVVQSANSTASAVFDGPLSVCGSDGSFYGNGPEVESIVTDALKSALSDRVASEALSFNPPTIFQPFPSYPIFLEYYLHDFQFVNGTNISARSAAILYAEKGSQNLTFIDTDHSNPPEASLYPPNTSWIASSSSKLPINGIRLSTAALTGVAQLANDLGYFAYGFRTQILDANLLFNMSFHRPTFSVDKYGYLDIIFPSGAMYGTCLNQISDDPDSGKCSNLGNMLHITFTNVTASTVVIADSNLGQVNVSVNISGFNFEHTDIVLYEPKIPLPGKLLQDILQDVAKQQIPEANKLLQQNPIQLPANIARLIDKPQIRVVPQPECCINYTHGYIEVDDYLASQVHGELTSSQRAYRQLLHVESIDEIDPRERFTSPSGSVMEDDSFDLILILYGSSSTINDNCRLTTHGDVAVNIALKAETNCTQLTDGSLDNPLFYSTVTTEESIWLTVSTSPFCTECLICDIPVEAFDCMALNSTMYHSALIARNDIVNWNPTAERFEGPLGAREVADDGVVALVAWEPSSSSAATCYTGYPVQSEADIRILILNLTIGTACTPMPAASSNINRSLFYTMTNNTEEAQYDANFECVAPAPGGCAACAVSVVSSYSKPICKNVSLPSFQIFEGILVVRGNSFMRFPAPPPTEHPTSSTTHSPTLPPVRPPPPPPWHTPVFIAVGVLCGLILIFALSHRYRQEIRQVFHKYIRTDHLILSMNINNDEDETRRTRQDWHATTVLDSIRSRSRSNFRHIYAYLSTVVSRGRLALKYCTNAMCALAIAVASFLPLLYTRIHDYLECHDQPSRVINVAVTLLSVLGSVCMALFAVWWTQNPFALFTGTVFNQVGLTGDYLSADEVLTNFDHWSKVGMWTLVGAAIASYCLAIKLFVSRSFKYVLPLLWIAIGISICGILLPPYTFIFSDGFVLNPDINNTILERNPGIVASIESGVGTGFASVAFSWYSVVCVLCLLGVSAGTFFSAVLFFMDNGYQGFNSEQREVLQLQYGRVTLVVWLAHIMAPLVQVLAVIILYQVTESNIWFLIVWALLWALGILCVWLLTTNHDLTEYNKSHFVKNRLHVIVLLYTTALLVLSGAILFMLRPLFTLGQYPFFVLLPCLSIAMITTLTYISLHQEYQTDHFLLQERVCATCHADVTGWLVCRVCETDVELLLPRRLHHKKNQLLSDVEEALFAELDVFAEQLNDFAAKNPQVMHPHVYKTLPLSGKEIVQRIHHRRSQPGSISSSPMAVSIGTPLSTAQLGTSGSWDNKSSVGTLSAQEVVDELTEPLPQLAENSDPMIRAVSASGLSRALVRLASTDDGANPEEDMCRAQYTCCYGPQESSYCTVCGDDPIGIRICCGLPSTKTHCTVCGLAFNDLRKKPQASKQLCDNCGAPSTGSKFCNMCGARCAPASRPPSRSVSRPPSPSAEQQQQTQGDKQDLAKKNKSSSTSFSAILLQSGDITLPKPECDPRLLVMWDPLWDFLTEKHEQQEPLRFGKRLPLRRLYLLIACICVGIYLFNVSMIDHSQSPEKKVQQFMQGFDSNLTWPKNGTAFNNLLDTYGKASDISDDVCLFGWTLLIFAVIVEPLSKPGRGLHLSRASAAMAMIVLFLGITEPASPNYVAELNFNEIVPYCAPEFNNFVDHLVRNLVGLACSGYFAAALFVVLLSISPALVRVSKIILLDRKLGSWKSFPSPMHLLVYKRNILIMMAWGSLLAPMLCFLPMLIFFQFYGDKLVGACFICFTLLPISAAFLATPHSVLKCYGLYLLFYFLPLFIVLFVEAKKHHFSAVITRNLRDPMTYVEIAAEITLANVVVSDVIYLSLSSWST